MGQTAPFCLTCLGSCVATAGEKPVGAGKTSPGAKDHVPRGLHPQLRGGDGQQPTALPLPHLPQDCLGSRWWTISFSQWPRRLAGDQPQGPPLLPSLCLPQ